MGFEACYQLYQGHTTRLVPRRHPPAPPRSLFFFVLVTFELLLSSSWYLQFRFLDFLSVQKIPTPVQKNPPYTYLSRRCSALRTVHRRLVPSRVKIHKPIVGGQDFLAAISVFSGVDRVMFCPLGLFVPLPTAVQSIRVHPSPGLFSRCCSRLENAHPDTTAGN